MFPCPWLTPERTAAILSIFAFQGLVILKPLGYSSVMHSLAKQPSFLEKLTDLPGNQSLLEQGLVEQGLLVVAGPHALSDTMLTAAARLALGGPLRVLDAGNRFNAYTVSRVLGWLNRREHTRALERIQVARAFTCHQVLSLLEGIVPEKHPTLVIDLLDTFYDESINLQERLRLAELCAGRLQELSSIALVVTSLRPPKPPATDPTGILQIIRQAADQFVYQQPGDVRMERMF